MASGSGAGAKLAAWNCRRILQLIQTMKLRSIRTKGPFSLVHVWVTAESDHGTSHEKRSKHISQLDTPGDVSCLYPCADSRCKLEAAVKPPVERINLFPWWRLAPLDHGAHISCNSLPDVLCSKIKGLLGRGKGAANKHSRIDVRVEHEVVLLSRQKG
eukprot:5728665-Pleurochrysis_carterae.AAC.2